MLPKYYATKIAWYQDLGTGLDFRYFYLPVGLPRNRKVAEGIQAVLKDGRRSAERPAKRERKAGLKKKRRPESPV
jgi:hypothetical protein